MSRVEFWNSVADDMNATCSSNYTGPQCRQKFALLTSAHTVSKILKKKIKKIYMICIKFFNTFRTWPYFELRTREANEVELAESTSTNLIRAFGSCQINMRNSFINNIHILF